MVSFKVASAYSTDGTVAVTVSTSAATAVAVVLTTTASGYFSPNVIVTTPGDTAVRFVPFATAQKDEVLAQLNSTSRVEHMAQHVA